MDFDSSLIDYNILDNLSFFDFKEDNLNELQNNFNEEDEDEVEIKSNRELMYDIIQDNYTQIKNSLLILRRRLIIGEDIINSKRGKKPNYLFNTNNIDENNKNIDNSSKKRKLNDNNKKKHKHSKFDYDNMFYKVKVSYHNFLTDLVNDIYNYIDSYSSKKIIIRRISGKITQDKTIAFNKELGELTIKNFLLKSISDACSYSSENSNKEIIESIFKGKDKYQKLISLLNYKYKEFYQNYFIKDNCINLIEKNFNVIIKKRKFRTFKEYIDKLYKKESKEYIIKFIDFAKYKFINYLEGNRVNLKIIYDTKLNDLFVNINNTKHD